MKKIIFILLLAMLMIPNTIKAASYETWGADIGGITDDGGTNTVSSGVKIIRSNYFAYTFIKVDIAYYENKKLIKTLATKYIFNTNNAIGSTEASVLSQLGGSKSYSNIIYASTNGLKNIFPQCYLSSKYNGKEYNCDFAGILQKNLLNESGNYANMQKLFNVLGLKYADIEKEYLDGNHANGKLGTGNGIRVVFTPVYSYCVTKKNSLSCSDEKVLGTLQDLAKKNINNTYPKLTLGQIQNYGRIFYDNSGDLWNTSGEFNLNEVASGNSKYGHGVFAPFGHKAPDENPSDICNPDEEGVFTCCKKFKITSSTSLNNNTTNMTRKLTDSELIEAGCSSECDYKQEDNLTTSCTDNKDGAIKDMDDWKCIFNSTKESDESKYKNYYVRSNDNPYCYVYCRQEVYSYLSSIVSVYQGRYMTVNLQNNASYDITPITYSGTTQCKVTNKRAVEGVKNVSAGIDEEQFLKDLEIANKNLETAKNNYQSGRGTLKEYNSALLAQSELISSFESCTTLMPKIETNFQPVVKFTYEEPKYGSLNENWTLNSKKNEFKQEIKYYIDGNSIDGGSKFISSVDSNILTHKAKKSICNLNGDCHQEEFGYKTSNWWISETKETYSYTLPKNVYRYVIKGTGVSVHSKSDVKTEYIDLGFSTLPIDFYTKVGTYKYNITLSSLGENNKLNEYLKNNNKDNYSCSYNVIDDQDCDCTDPNCDAPKCGDSDCDDLICRKIGNGKVIYRTISLYSKKDAFPGIEGDGREPGANWDSLNDEIVKTYIVNNRGVTDYDVYHLDPLYEIELTPKLIKKIRAYNKEKNKQVIEIDTGEYGIVGYANFDNIACDSNGTHCIDSFIRGTVPNYSLIKVQGCAIKSSGSYNNCGTRNEAW